MTIGRATLVFVTDDDQGTLRLVSIEKLGLNLKK